MTATTTRNVEVERWAALSTATIAAQLARRGFRNQFMPGMRSYGGSIRCAGAAFTVRLVPARPDAPGGRPGAFEDVLESVPAGQILVVDAGGQPGAATIGDMMATRLLARGVAGVVTDGAVRDSAGLAAVAFPVQAPTVTANLRSGVFDVTAVGQTVVCAGVTVIPGDLVVVDVDGPIVIPTALAAEIAEEAADQERFEEYIVGRLRRGDQLIGLHPASETTRAEFRRWQADAAAEPDATDGRETS